MARKEPSRIGVCTYCEAEGPVTDDHVPPRKLFPKGTSGLIVVDACEACNEGAKKDDELFIHAVSISHDPATVPGDRTLERVRRKLEEGRPGLVLHTRRDTVRTLRITSEEGEREARASYSTDEDKARLRGVIKRYARGIYFHETGKRIPPHRGLTVAKLPQPVIASRADIELYGRVFGPALEAIGSVTPRSVGGEVFEYRLLAEEDAMILYLLFFGVNEFIITSEPR